MFNLQCGRMTDLRTPAEAKARIDSWWRLPTAAAADEAARGALELMPWSAGLIRFAVFRSPTEPTVFLQSLWTTAAARDHYVHHVAPVPRASIDDRVPQIERQRSLTEVVAVVTHADAVAAKWTTRRLPATAEADLHALVSHETARLREGQPPGLVRATVGIGHDLDGKPTEVIVTEEWSDPDLSGYAPFGAVTPAPR